MNYTKLNLGPYYYKYIYDIIQGSLKGDRFL